MKGSWAVDAGRKATSRVGWFIEVGNNCIFAVTNINNLYKTLDSMELSNDRVLLAMTASLVQPTLHGGDGHLNLQFLCVHNLINTYALLTCRSQQVDWVSWPDLHDQHILSSADCSFVIFFLLTNIVGPTQSAHVPRIRRITDIHTS